MNLLKNRLFRIIGIVAILYFALFDNTHKKNSLGNRLSKERVKKNIKEIKEKSVYIITNLKKAESFQDRKIVKSEVESVLSKITVENIRVGKGKPVGCNQLVFINYEIYINNQLPEQPEQLEYVENYQFIIADPKIDKIISDNLIGMKKEGIRLVTIPSNYKTNNKQLKEYFDKSNKKIIYYKIILLDMGSISKKYDC